MADKLSRTKLARYVAGQLADGSGEAVIQELAAYLVETGRTREAELVVRAIYEQLEAAGTVVADVTSAEAIDAELRTELEKLVGAKQLLAHESVDPSLLGGVLVRTPSRVLDATFRRRLNKLRERKV